MTEIIFPKIIKEGDTAYFQYKNGSKYYFIYKNNDVNNPVAHRLDGPAYFLKKTE